MDKVLTFIAFLLFSGSITGQQTTDYLLKAKALTGSGKQDMAIDLLSGALTSDQNDSRLYIERAEAKLMKGDYQGAIGDFNTANKISPNSGEFGLARIYALKGDAATAVYHLEKNLTSTFKKNEKEIMLDPSFSVIENRPEWRQIWKKDWYSNLDKGISEIEYYLSIGSSDEANGILEALKANYNSEDELLYAEALISYSRGRYSEVIKTLSGFINNEPLHENYLRLYAKAQVGNGNPAGASETYTKLLNMEVIDAGLLISRAECYRKTGETVKALDDLKRYLDIYPGDKTALSLAGKMEAASGDNLKALTYFSENLKLHPGDPVCYIDRANSYFISKSWNWAINDYSMSLDLDPGNSDIWLNKGIALLNSGKPEDACHDFRRSLSLGNKKAAEYINRNCIK